MQFELLEIEVLRVLQTTVRSASKRRFFDVSIKCHLRIGSSLFPLARVRTVWSTPPAYGGSHRKHRLMNRGNPKNKQF
jgi:hypothetical protein